MLVVGGDERYSRAMCAALRAQGVAARGATMPATSQLKAQHDMPVVLVDARASNQRAIDACRSLRSHGLNNGIVALLGNDVERERAAVIDSGADDCIVPATPLRELAARLRAVQRRSHRSYDFGFAAGLNLAGSQLVGETSVLGLPRKLEAARCVHSV